ncbi:MAG: glycosyltransferase family 4 protein [Planctomycetaceae bacterium]|nr:glycosyltransferase family 4 protein [Planctomycetaceae bacterium]MBT6498215.1 glycosyltransferase family 4 protein [Planctomycetaceae bacterium]
MRIWLLKDGETLPVQDGSRKMRTWMLAEALAKRGHDVVWWSSTFSHQRKELVARSDETFRVCEGVTLKLLHSGSYRRNVSVRRLLHHRTLARRFSECADSEAPPDIIVSAYPIIEVASQAVQFAKRNAIPIVVDVRDLWPDYFLEHIPRILRTPANFALRGAYRQKQHIIQNADSVVATTEGILRWALQTGGRERMPFDRPFHLGYPASNASTAAESMVCPEYLRPFRDRTIFTFVGIFGSAYDLETVCRAAKVLADEGDERVHFVFAGTGGRFDEISAQARGLPNVTMPGWLWKEQIDALLQHSDVGLVPFYDGIPDAMPNKVFEYLSAGLPLMTCLSGELRDLVESCRIGYYYRDGDHSSLLAGIRKIASDGILVENMSKNARSVFEERFTADTVYGAYAEHIEQLHAASTTECVAKAAA